MKTPIPTTIGSSVVKIDKILKKLNTKISDRIAAGRIIRQSAITEPSLPVFNDLTPAELSNQEDKYS